MAYIHYERREIHLKVVYFGPHRSGKTTAVRHIHGKTSREPATESGPSAGDYLALTLGTIRGFVPTLHLYAASGAPAYAAERSAMLEKADGVVLLADGAPSSLEANVASHRELEATLAAHGFALASLPFVLQVNKQDLPDALEAPALARVIGVADRAFFGSVATTGAGVFEVLKEVSRQVLQELRRGGEQAPPPQGG